MNNLLNKRIVFSMPLYAGTEGEAGGVYNELLYRKTLAAKAGYETAFHNHWQALKEFNPEKDVFHVFMANNGMLDFVQKLKSYGFKVVVSPILDTRWSAKRVNFFVSLIYKFRVIHAHLKSARQICTTSDAVCSRSKQESEMLSIGLDTDSSKIHCILNAPKRNLVKQSELDSLSKENTIFFLGNWGTERKNVLRLVKAMNGIDAKLVLAGAASETSIKAEVEILAEKNENIEIKGFLTDDEVESLYRTSRVFAMPSLFEGTGLSALDAMSYGTNVLITTEGGVSDYFDENAYFVNPRSVESIQNGLNAGLSNDFSPLSDDYLKRFELTSILKNTKVMYESV